MDIREWRGDERLAQDEPVASLLRAAAAPSEPGPQPGEEAALAAFRATRQTIGRTPMRSTRMKAAFAAAVSAGVLLTGGIAAAAATGTLPGAAQLGIGTHAKAAGADNANENADTSGDSADQTGDTDETTDPTDQVTDQETEAPDTESSTSTDSTDAQDETSDATDGEQAAPEHPANHGDAVSQAAKTDSPTGREHGQLVSSTARTDAGKQDHTTSGQSADRKPTDPSATGKAASDAKGDNAQQGQDNADAGQAGAQSGAHAGAKAGGR